jgi:hypothetical protein
MRPSVRFGVSAVALLSIASAYSLVGSAAHAATVPRGNTTLLSCDDVTFTSKIKDATGHGVDQTVRNVKRSAIVHTERALPGMKPYYPTYETDLDGTPDIGDTDTCTGPLSNPTSSDWNGSTTPYAPIQNHVGSIDEITAITGALVGRVTSDVDSDNDGVADCADPSPGTPDPSQWVEHGKLIITFGNDGAGKAPLTLPTLDVLGRKVQSQLYVSVQAGNAPDNSAVPADADTCPDTADAVTLSGIGIKGVGEGAYFDAHLTKRVPSANFVKLFEVQSNSDINGDGVIGEKPIGGILTEVFDTDVDDAYGGGTLTGTLPSFYDNSFVWSIDS